MADFRKPKYSGSLNLAPECGPVLIELDTEAKTATASLEDPASQYTLAGGGGGLEYVIPEQTVKNGDSLTVNDSALSDRESYIFKIKVALPEYGADYYVSKYYTADAGFDQIELSDDRTTVTIYKETNWIFECTEDQLNYTISAIRGF